MISGVCDLGASLQIRERRLKDCRTALFCKDSARVTGETKCFDATPYSCSREPFHSCWRRAARRRSPVAPLDANSYATQTLQIGTLAKITSQITLTQSGSFPIKKFATSEILEQTAAAQSLTNNFDPPPAPLSPDQQQIVASLQELSGPDFDTAYIKAQIDGHEQLLVLQQGYLQADTNPASDLVDIALIASAFIETHLGLLHDLLVRGRL